MNKLNNSNYVFNRDPGLYGNNQGYYLGEVSRVVGEAVYTVKQGIESRVSLTELFFAVLERFGHERKAIAIKTGSINAESFGLRRDGEEGFGKNAMNCTILIEKYEEYGVKMCTLLQNILTEMPHDFKSFKNTSCYKESICCGRKSSFELEVLDKKPVDELWVKPPSPERLGEICPENVGLKGKMELLKHREPAVYTQTKMHLFLKAINQAFLYTNSEYNLKSHWVLAKSRCEIDGKMYALSQYLTYMCFTDSTDPVKRMTGRSKVTIIHQDPFLIESTLKEISKIFEKAVRWDSKTEELSVLKERVGLFRYLFAQSTPFNRGSAAIGEWFQDVIYNFHGYTAVQSFTDKAWDLEALTARSLGDFMGVYNELTRPEKLPLQGCS